jgi:hypothetical protein
VPFWFFCQVSIVMNNLRESNWERPKWCLSQSERTVLKLNTLQWHRISPKAQRSNNFRPKNGAACDEGHIALERDLTGQFLRG